MNLHEYQSKRLFADYGIPVPRGIPAESPNDAVKAAQELGGDLWVVKAQVHAGGRGKAGGVKLARTRDEVRQFAEQMLGNENYILQPDAGNASYALLLGTNPIVTQGMTPSSTKSSPSAMNWRPISGSSAR